MTSCQDITDIALRAGTLVLENGGETYRAEETIVRIANALGAKSPSAFVTPTVIIFTFVGSDECTHSGMKRITVRGTNLEKVSRINTLSRIIATKTISIKEIKEKLTTVENAPNFSKKLIITMASFSSFFFALMFGGSFKEGFYALLIGGLLRIILIFLELITRNTFTISLVSGAFTAILVSMGNSSLLVLVSVLMQVVPGIAITNAMRDMIAGDLVSGTARMFEAFMIAVGLSAGAAAGLLLTGGTL